MTISLAFFVDFQLEHIADLGEDVVGEGGEQGDALEEAELVLHLLDAGALHDLLEHQPLHAPQLSIRHRLLEEDRF